MQFSVLTCSLHIYNTEGIVHVYKDVIMTITMEESHATMLEL